ncbi:MAG: tetratricopeptide repeat protein [Nitrospirota bacterium]
MMLPYSIAGLILLPVLLTLLYPLWRASRRPILMGNEAVLDELKITTAIEKETLLRGLSSLEVDFSQGKMDVPDYQRIKLSQEHELLNLLNQGETSSQTQKTSDSLPSEASPRPWGLMVGLCTWIIAFAVGVSSLVHGRIQNNQMAASAGSQRAEPGPMPGEGGMPDPAKMVARLEEKIKANPNDLSGQMMLGRSYMVMNRLEEAKKTWLKVLELDERNPTAHASLGEILLRTNSSGDPKNVEKALVYFDKALISSPQDPSILWGRGVALVQIGRLAEAEEAWVAVFGALSPGTEEAEMVKQALEALRSGKMKGS